METFRKELIATLRKKLVDSYVREGSFRYRDVYLVTATNERVVIIRPLDDTYEECFFREFLGSYSSQDELIYKAYKVVADINLLLDIIIKTGNILSCTSWHRCVYLVDLIIFLYKLYNENTLLEFKKFFKWFNYLCQRTTDQNIIERDYKRFFKSLALIIIQQNNLMINPIWYIWQEDIGRYIEWLPEEVLVDIISLTGDKTGKPNQVSQTDMSVF